MPAPTGPEPQHHPQVPEGAAAWDERYRGTDALFSGRPNHALVQVLGSESLAPGLALDVGCGEGGDALWLAAQGWHVTGVDISSVAIGRAAHAADASGLDGRTAWIQADLETEPVPPGPWDLVNAQYLHLRPSLRVRLWSALAAVVAPGGTLLVVAHDRSDPHVADHAEAAGERFHGPEEVLDALGPDWDIRHAGPLAWTRPGEPATDAVDLVVHAVRPR